MTSTVEFVKVIGTFLVVPFSILDAVPPVKLYDIRWSFTNRFGVATPLENENSFGVTFSPNRATLTIVSVSVINTGTYTISVSNPVGNSSRSVQLNVLGK